MIISSNPGAQNRQGFRVSCIIPTCNRRERLSGAIASVIAQTVPVNEIIVIDDGSTDGTFDMLQALGREVGQVRIAVLRQENRGPAAARNAGLRIASGDLVAFLDDDDVWHPEKTARQLAVFSSRPEIDLLGCASDTLKMPGGSRLFPISEWGMLFRNWFLTPTVMVRRELVLSCGGFPEDMRHCEDYALWLRIVVNNRCAFLNDVQVSCGHGKAPFGANGLSADLRALRGGEKTALDRWREHRHPDMIRFLIVSLWAYVRHLRRLLIVRSRRCS
ncbi:MAG: glycosyltransferase family A protein [Candidatus Accumulibacter delftensis]|jgi:glycosyltransferase involved in cell wall biosynthesis